MVDPVGHSPRPRSVFGRAESKPFRDVAGYGVAAPGVGTEFICEDATEFIVVRVRRGECHLVGADQEVSVLRTGGRLDLDELWTTVWEEGMNIEPRAVPLHLRSVHHPFGEITAARCTQMPTLAFQDQ